MSALFLEETVVKTESEFRLLVVSLGLSGVYEAVTAAALKGKIDELQIVSIEEKVLEDLDKTALGLKNALQFTSAIPRAIESLRLILATIASARNL